MDEADYLSEGDITTIMAIAYSNNNVKVWASSTPTGRRTHFFNWCTNEPEWKEFHFPSSVMPHWDKKMEVRARADAITELKYRHEFLAEFADQEVGVYGHGYIQNAKRDYRYSDMSPNRNWIYIMGVDWNEKKIGTEVCVVGLNPVDQKFWIVAQDTIQKVDFAQLKGVQRIIELNRYWKPRWIYVDAGYGHTNVEVLRAEGNKARTESARGAHHPDAALANNIQAYDFGSNVTIYDLFTQEEIKKPAKPFLVQNSVRRFENDEIRFSKHDESLEKQLQNYVIDKISPKGVYSYKAENERIGDHKLDALNLALVGFFLEFTEFGKPKFSIDIAFSGQFGSKRVEKEINEDGWHDKLEVRYDPEYEKRKRYEATKSSSTDRTAGFVDPATKPILGGQSLPANIASFQVGFWKGPPGASTDEEWKYEAKQKIMLKRRRVARPERSNI